MSKQFRNQARLGQSLPDRMMNISHHINSHLSIGDQSINRPSLGAATHYYCDDGRPGGTALYVSMETANSKRHRGDGGAAAAGDGETADYEYDDHTRLLDADYSPVLVGSAAFVHHANDSHGSSGEDDSEKTQNQGDQEEDSPVASSVYLLTGMAAVGGFLFGYDTGVVSGALLLLARQFDLSSSQQEILVSATVALAIVGAVASGKMSKRWVSHLGKPRCFGLFVCLIVHCRFICMLCAFHSSFVLTYTGHI